MNDIALTPSAQSTFTKAVEHIKKLVKDGDLKVIDDGIRRPRRGSHLCHPDRGVIYLGHIPHGFHENEMWNYFSQFGKVTQIRLARSAKSGRSKGYGFIEFYNDEVAKIVAETMNNYLMFERLLKCEYIPLEKRHQKMFRQLVTYNKVPADKKRNEHFARMNKQYSREDNVRYKLKMLKHVAKLQKSLKDLGLDYEFEIANKPEFSEEEKEIIRSLKERKKAKQLKNNSTEDDNDEDDEDDDEDEDDSDDSNNCYSEDDDDDSDAEETPPPVFEVDESDNEIEFRTPPTTVRRKMKMKDSPGPAEDSDDPEITFNTPGSFVRAPASNRSSTESVSGDLEKSSNKAGKKGKKRKSSLGVEANNISISKSNVEGASLTPKKRHASAGRTPNNSSLNGSGVKKENGSESAGSGKKRRRSRNRKGLNNREQQASVNTISRTPNKNKNEKK